MADTDSCEYLDSRNELRIDISQRFGNAIVSSGTLDLRNRRFADDFTPIEENCTCVCCRSADEGGLGITKAYMYHVAAKETVGAHL